MSSYNDYKNIKRIQVTNHASDEFVSLIEYIIFENEEGDKYAIFKFQNNLEQYLFEIKAVVTQFDKEGRIIEKSTISYANFRVDGKEVLVPDAKFKCNKNCDTLSTELVYGAFEKIIYDNGNIVDVKYDYQDYKEDFDKYTNGTNGNVQIVKSKKELKRERKLSKKEAKLQRKLEKKNKGTVVVDITNQNKTKAMLSTNIVFSIVIIVLCAIFAIQFRINGERLRDNGILYVTKYDTAGNRTLQVKKFEGSTDAIIASEVDGVKVTSIAANAFAKTDVVTVTINANLSVEGGAFNNCPNLTKVQTGDNVTCVFHSLSFANCPQLVEINVPNSEMQINSISSGITTLLKLTFNTTNKASNLARLFNGFSLNSEISSSLVVTVTSNNFSEDFFEGFTGTVIKP